MGLCAVVIARLGATGACRAPAVASKSEATSVLEVDELRAMVCEACSVSSVWRCRCKLCHTEEMMRCGCFTVRCSRKNVWCCTARRNELCEAAIGSCNLEQAINQRLDRLRVTCFWSLLMPSVRDAARTFELGDHSQAPTGQVEATRGLYCYRAGHPSRDSRHGAEAAALDGRAHTTAAHGHEFVGHEETRAVGAAHA